MNNNYTWNLDSICHVATGSAHYSNNWNKQQQDDYNKKYYEEHKADKWGVKGGYNETKDSVSYSGRIGDERDKDYNSFMKNHGGEGENTDDDFMGEKGDYYLAKAKDGSKAIVREDQVVASGKDLDDVDMQPINKYLTDIYTQAEDHLKAKGIKENSKEASEFYKKFNTLVDGQVKGLIAKQKQKKIKHSDTYGDILVRDL